MKSLELHPGVLKKIYRLKNQIMNKNHLIVLAIKRLKLQLIVN